MVALVPKNNNISLTNRSAPRILGGFSLCIISGGKRWDKVCALVESIKAQNLPRYEIILSGVLNNQIPGVDFIEMKDEAQAGRTSSMRNRAMQAARYETIVMSDDDIVLDKNFANAVVDHIGHFDVLCVRMRNPDGSRLWDWATAGGPTGQHLLNYDEIDEFLYVSSGIFVIAKYALEKFGYFDETRGFYQAEDLEFSQRIRAKGAVIQFCAQAGALHNDTRYTQFDDYPRRIANFSVWEEIADGVSARGLYAWNGSFPVAREAQLRLTNTAAVRQSFCFVLGQDRQGDAFQNWRCTLYADGERFAEFTRSKVAKVNLIVPSNSTKLISLRSSDVTVPFASGAFRNQKAIACYMSAISIRDPNPDDIVLPAVPGRLDFSALDESGIAVFAPCMTFGAFALNCRNLVRHLHATNTSFGLEFHSVDHWFSRLCFGLTSSARSWSFWLKQRKYCGVNLVCVHADNLELGFLDRARISRPGYHLNYALVGGKLPLDSAQELKRYDGVYVFSQFDAEMLLSYGICANILGPQWNPRLVLQSKGPREDQPRAVSIAIVIDRDSNLSTAMDYVRQVSLESGESAGTIAIFIFVFDTMEVFRSTQDFFQGESPAGNQRLTGFTIKVIGVSLEADEEIAQISSSTYVLNLAHSSTKCNVD